MAGKFGFLLKPKFTFSEMESGAKKLLDELYKTKEKKLPKKLPKMLGEYSDYQLGQFAFYFTFRFYKLSPEKRQKSKEGRMMYAVLVELYKHKAKKDFQNGFNDEKIKTKLSDEEKFSGFAAAYLKHDTYYKKEQKEGRTPIPFVNYLLEGLDRKELAKIIPKPKKVDWLPLVKDETLNRFLSAFKVEIGAGATKEEKVGELTKAFVGFFETDEEKAGHVLKAVLYTYSVKIKEIEGEPFIKWFRGLGKKDREKLLKNVTSAKAMKGLALPTEEVMKIFLESKKAKEEKKKEIKKLEKELADYPVYISEINFKEMTKNLESKPRGRGIEIIEERLDYLDKKKTLLEMKKDEKGLKEIEKEVAVLGEWLKKFGLTGTAREQLATMKNGMKMIDFAYLTMGPEALLLAELFDRKKYKYEPALYDLYAEYMLGLDMISAGIFRGLKPESKYFSEQIANTIVETFSKETMVKSMETWTKYYGTAYPLMDSEEMEKLLKENPMEVGPREYMANLGNSPLIANAFFEYAKRVEESGVGSEKEMEEVAKTAVKLAALHPMLVMKYFNAMRKIAYICRDNPQAYMEALTSITGWVEGLTAPVFQKTQLTMLNVRNINDKLDSAFTTLSELDENKLAQYSKYDLMDNNIYISPEAPHVIKQHSHPGYMYSLTEGKKGIPHNVAASPLPPHLQVIPPGMQFSGGGLTTYGPRSYGGMVQFQQFNPLQIYSGTEIVKGAVENYMWAGHPIIPVPEYFPQTHISGISSTELLNEINRAFITTTPLGYSKKPISGGFAGGFLATKVGEDWVYGGGGLGSYLTSTGGMTVGGTYEGGGSIFAGGTAVMLPMGTIKKGVKKGAEVGIESAAGGFEQLDDRTKTWLLEAITNTWDPENPSEHIIITNGEQTAEGKAWANSRFFYVDKNGAVFEISGGYNDFVEMLNFLAGYFDKPFKTPILGAWNVEPTVKPPKGVATGGGALAVDIGKTAWLGHFQSVPFVTADTKSTISVLEERIRTAKETLGNLNTDLADAENRRLAAVGRKSEAEDELAAANAQLESAETEAEIAAAQARINAAQGALDEIEGQISDIEDEIDTLNSQIADQNSIISQSTDAKDDILESGMKQPLLYEWTLGAAGTKYIEGEATKVYEVTLPGKMMYISKEEKEEQYVLQDAQFMMRHVEGKEAWELVLGGGIGEAAVKLGEKEPEKELIGRGGFLFKKETPKIKVGGGLFYAGGKTHISELAMLEESEAMRNYIEGLHKIGETFYIGGDIKNAVLLGALGHVVEQFRIKETMMGKEAVYDETFWRFIGFLKGMDETGIRIDVSKIPGFENVLNDYDELLKNVNKNPKQAAYYIDDFKSEYEEDINRIFYDYYLGVQIGKNFSLEGKLVAKEEEDGWKQVPEYAQARALLTWDTGFWRVYASLPTWMGGAKLMKEETKELGVPEKIALVGTGIGFDAFGGLLLQRIAVDGGLLLAMKELETEEPGVVETKTEVGGFVEGAVMLFSNIIDDSKKYRKLKNKYAKYTEMIKKGRFDKIPDAELRKKLCANIPKEVGLTPAIIKKIINGEKNVLLTGDQQKALLSNLWDWFYDEKTKLEEKFNGKIKTYLAAQGYIFDLDEIHWDVGAYFEYIDAVKAYVIASVKKEISVYSGLDIKITPKVILSAVGGVTPETKEGGGGISLRINFNIKGVPSSLSIYGYGWSDKPNNYTNPAYGPYEASGKIPEVGCFFLLTIGGGGTPMVVSPKMMGIPGAPPYP
jgi:hypothetical protein